MSNWSRDCTLEFIEKYRSHDCIWRVKCQEYHNRDKKEAAYTDLLDLVKSIDPHATKDTIVKKINNLRSAFRKELKKVKRTQKLGRDDAYVPRLWYFNDLLFLLDQEDVLEGISNLEGSDQEDLSTEDAPPFEKTTCTQQSAARPELQHASNSSNVRQEAGLSTTRLSNISDPNDNNSFYHRSPSDGPSRAVTITNSSGKQSFKRARNLTPSHQILVSVDERLAEAKQDQFDVFGKNVSEKLRLLNNEQRIFAQKLINDTLFEAELGSLYRNASINPGFPHDRRPPSNLSQQSNHSQTPVEEQTSAINL